MSKLKHFPTAGEVIENFGSVRNTAEYFNISRVAVGLWDKDAPILEYRFFEMWYQNPEFFEKGKK